MEITVKDRQTLLDLAIAYLGSAAGVFALVGRNGISLTTRLKDGQSLIYEAEDIIAPNIREAFSVRRLSPATDMDGTEYKKLLSDTGSAIMLPELNLPDLPPILVNKPMYIDPLEQAIADAAAGRPPKENTQIHLTRIFQNPFDDIFA